MYVHSGYTYSYDIELRTCYESLTRQRVVERGVPYVERVVASVWVVISSLLHELQ